MDLSRRTILRGAPVLGAAAALPVGALAAPVVPGAELAASLRARWAEGRRAFLEGVLGQPAESAPAELAVIAEGVAALDVVKEIELLEPATQVQPPLQRLFWAVLSAVGRSSQMSAAAMAAWLAPGGDADDPAGRHVRGAMGALRIGMRGAKTRAARRELVDRSLAELLDDPEPGRLRAEARRLVRRTRKAERLAAHLAADPEAFARTFGLEPARAAAMGLDAATLSAAAAHRTSAGEGAAEEADYDVGRVLGMLALGVVSVAGFLVAVVGLCLLLCDGGAVGIVAFLLGAVLVTFSVVGRRTLLRKWDAEDAADEAPGVDPACPPCPPCPKPEAAIAAPPGERFGQILTAPEPVGWVSVPADAGWVGAPAVAPAQQQLCLAWGLVQTGRAWPADPDGDGVAAGPGAPLPGAPSGALVGRVGARTFFLGAEGLVPPGLSGPLLLSLNLSPAAAAQARGGVEVQLLRRPRGSRDA